MVKTYKIVLILAFTALFFIGLAVYNLVVNSDRTFSLINLPQYEMCFLIPSDYEVTKTAQGFRYKLKDNYGEFRLLKRGLSSDLVRSNLAGVEAGYKKLVNDRIFEYKLNDDYTLHDRFFIIKKRQPNLIPLKGKCPQLLKLYPVIMELRT